MINNTTSMTQREEVLVNGYLASERYNEFLRSKRYDIMRQLDNNENHEEREEIKRLLLRVRDDMEEAALLMTVMDKSKNQARQTSKDLAAQQLFYNRNKIDRFLLIYYGAA